MENKQNFNEFHAYEKARAIARRYINIFHQLHVLNAGLEVLNKDFLTISDDVIEILPTLSGGTKFYQHIQNLKSGVTAINKIALAVLPFGEEVFEDESLFLKYVDTSEEDRVKVSKAAALKQTKTAANNPKPEVHIYSDVFKLVREFVANPTSLEAFKTSEEIRELGPDWKNVINSLINSSNEPDKEVLKKNFEGLLVFDKALNIWHECVEIIKNPRQRTKDDLRSNLAIYKSYLSMFGNGGADLYAKIEHLAS